MGTLTASELLPLFGRKSQTQAFDPLPSTLPSTISNPEQLPVTSATNGDGNQAQVSIFAMPGSEAEEVPLWQFFKEAPVNDSPGPSSILDLTTVTLDDVSEQASEEEAALQQERDDEDYQALSFLLDYYKTLHVPAAQYKRNTCRFCNKPLKERKYLTIHLGHGKSKKIACTKYGGILARRETESSSSRVSMRTSHPRRRSKRFGRVMMGKYAAEFGIRDFLVGT